jgi:hypothetical protein
MPNTINNIKDVGSVIAKMAAGMLADELQFLKSVDKEPATSFGQKDGYNVGDTINISKPARFIPSSTADITSTIQDVVEEKVPLVLNTRSIVPIALTSAEIQNTLSLKSWANRVLKPAASSIAQNVEAAFLTTAKNNVYQSVGTAGSTVFDPDTMLAARQQIKQSLAPAGSNLYALLNSSATRLAVNSRKGLPNSQADIAKQYRDGYIMTADGFTYLENNLLPVHTNGADVTGIAVEASVVTIANGMSTLGVDGVTSGATITAGTVFTISGVNSVHPITKVDTGALQQFVVTESVTETSGNSVTLKISPSIYYTTTDPRRNVTAAPVDETGALVFVGAASTGYTQNIAFHPSAFRFASVPLVQPDGLDMVGQETVDGITIRVLRDYDILTDKLIMRLDFLGGFTAVRPEWSCKITA